ncbi:MAG: hypothetical protein ASARMPRED_006304 [Alectoria sarmentosa]|nr:MAG: hypothetical protein ASARMPRED_006304 [Alectoria sarmentosa]
MFEGQDPPRTLSPAAALVPTPTNVDTDTQQTVASPIPSILHLPLKTGAGNLQPADPDPTQNSPSKPVDPSASDSGDPSNSNAPSKPEDPSTGDSGDSSDADSPNDPSAGDSGDSSDANPPTKPKGPLTGESGDSSNDDSTPRLNDPSTKDPGDFNDSQGPADNPASPASAAPDTTKTPASDPPANSPSKPSAADFHETKNTPLAFPSAVVLQGHTITQGAAPVITSKTPVVYQSGSISAGGEIQAIPTSWGQGNENASPMTVGGLTFSAIPSAAKADGDPQNGNSPAAKAAQISGPAANNLDPATYITVGGQTIAVEANALSVAGTNLKPGDPGITIDGTPISLGSSIFVVGSRTETLSSPPSAITAPPSYITVGGQTIGVGSSAIIDGTTLQPADPGIIVDGTRVSLGSSILVVGTHTQNLNLLQPTATAAPSYMTIGGETITVAASSIVVAGHTVIPGGPAEMVDGTLISLGSSILVIGTKTMSFTLPAASISASSSEGIGAMILKGLGGIGVGTVAAPIQTTSYNGTRGVNGTVVFMGGAKRGDIRFKGWVGWIWTVVVFFF